MLNEIKLLISFCLVFNLLKFFSLDAYKSFILRNRFICKTDQLGRTSECFGIHRFNVAIYVIRNGVHISNVIKRTMEFNTDQ